MKNLKIYFLALMVLITFNACDDTLDINTNPLVASAADANVVLPYVFVQYSSRHTTELGTRITDVSQLLSANFNSPRQGRTSIFLTGNTWGMYYTQVLGNLLLVEQDAEAAGAGQNNINAIAKIWKAKAFFELSSIWEEIPFSQALDGNQFPQPIFDSQESIFRGCLTILDQAISLIDAIPAEGSADVSTGDLIFDGDMDKWRRWANSLRLRIAMMIRNRDTGIDGDITKYLSEPLIESNDQAPLIRYSDEPGQQNGFQTLVTQFFGPSNEDAQVHGPGEPLFNLLKDTGDPRFDLFILDPDPEEEGPLTGTFPSGMDAVIRDNIIRFDLPHILYLPSEVSFYRAELALKGVTNENADELFKQGVRQILEFWGQDVPGADISLSDDDINAFVDALPEATLQRVHEQQYLETFLRPVVAWNTVRRTKVPEMEEVPGSTIGTILKRFNYPPDEVGSNPNTPANLPTDTPMWFEN